MATSTNFYRRVLPELCIDFQSQKGKQYFKDALEAGYMESYFKLGSQLRTQDEPAFCGLTSLVIVLNAFAVDPGIVWKGVWRWYHEDMLDCCISLDDVKKDGITLDQLSCLAKCNQLKSELIYVNHQEQLEKFRENVKRSCQEYEHAIICSFSRGTLGQTGTGHFSPIGGYNPKEDAVLVLEPARFKYPPYWLALTDLFAAMNTLDKENQTNRGYLLLKKSESQPTLLFKLARSCNPFHLTSTETKQWLKKIHLLLSETHDKDASDEEIFKTVCKRLFDSAPSVKVDLNVLVITRITTERLKTLSPDHQSAIYMLVRTLESTDLFTLVRKSLAGISCCRQNMFSQQEALCQILNAQGLNLRVGLHLNRFSNTETKVSRVSRTFLNVDSVGLHNHILESMRSFDLADLSAFACCMKEPCVLCTPHYMTILFLVLPVFDKSKPQPALSYFAAISRLAKQALAANPTGTDEQRGVILLRNEAKQLKKQLRSIMCDDKFRCPFEENE